jgi:hypothetical protein
VALSVPVDRVRVQARGLQVGRGLLTALFLLPFLMGWCAGMMRTAAVWAWAAMVAGYRQATDRPAGRGGRT